MPAGGIQDSEWRAWMRDFGSQQRKAREFLGLSQEQLARAAGVSQGAVSRLEAGRGLATPLLIVLKLNLVIARHLRSVDPALLTDELKRAMDVQDAISPPVGESGFPAIPLLKDARLEEIVRLYLSLPDSGRETYVSVARSIASALRDAKNETVEGNR